MSDIKTNLNVAPYNDTTELELAKGYFRYLAKEGQVLQNRELNVAQGLIYGNLRKVSDLLVEDGSVVSGCNFVNNAIEQKCYLYAGEIYINGLIIKIDANEWTYANVPTGLAYVCVRLAQTVYTEEDDPSLVDPAETMENYGQPGGHRLKYDTTTVIYSDADYKNEALLDKNLIAIIKLIDRDTYGPTKPKPVFGKLYNYLAQRTYDTSGDFIADGLKVYTQINRNNPDLKYTIRVSKGRAYINGFDYTYDKDAYLIQDSAINTRSCGGASIYAAETEVYASGDNSYYLNRIPIKSVESVSATVNAIINVTDPSMTYTISTQLYPQITSINRVYSGGTTYVRGSGPSDDYDVDAQNRTIVWNSLVYSSAPQPYSIDLNHSTYLTVNEDYYLSRDEIGTMINFTAGGNKPVDGSTFSISYTWYLSRYDLVYMKTDGMLAIKTGIPDELESIVEPKIPLGSLPLAYIKVEPLVSANNYNIDSFNIYRVPMVQLKNMKEKISDLEYNFAMSELENLAQNKFIEKDDITSLRNIFADAVTDYNKANLYNPRFDATIDLFRSEIRLPMSIVQAGFSDMTFTKSDGSTAIPTNGILQLDLNATSIVTDFQPYATHNVDIAPYYYRGLIPKLTCDPAKLSYIKDDETTSVVWLPNRVIYTSSTVNTWRRMTTSSTDTPTFSTRQTTSTTTSTTQTKTSTIIGEEVVETKQSQISMIPQPYINPGSIIKVVGQDFPANSEIRLYMDDAVITTLFTDPAYSSLTVTASDETTLELTDGSITWKPWVWRIGKKWWNGLSKYLYTFEHPTYTGENLSYQYDTTGAGQWYYFKTGDTNPTTMTTIPSWLKWIRRSPWIDKYIPELTVSQQTLVNSINNYDVLTNAEYQDDFAETSLVLVADSDGYFEVEIKIPENTPTGKHTITAETILPEDFDPEHYFSSSAEFSGESYIRHWENTITKRKVELVATTVYVQHDTSVEKQVKSTHRPTSTRRNVNHDKGGSDSDPVAQSFKLDGDQFINGIDLYFTNKSSDTTARVWLNIKEMVNGYPTGAVIYNHDIDVASINIAQDPTWTATHIDFDYPIFCEADKEYAFTVGCNIDGFHILYAKMGNRDIITGEQVVYQPHPSGVMFVSSNNNTWSAVQDSDITYSLYRQDFDTTNKVFYIYNSSSIGAFSMFNTSIDNVVLDNTDIKFEYALLNGDLVPSTEVTSVTVNWQPLNLEEMYNVSKTADFISKGMFFAIKVTLSSTDSKVSPVMNAKTFETFFAKYKTSGSYIQIPLSIG